MLRFFHTADWQLGAPHPPIYKERMLEELVCLARQYDINLIFCIGDIFDKPKPEQKIKDYLLKNILESEDITWIFCPGNHDYETKDKQYSSLRFLELLEPKLNNIKVCNEGNHVLINDNYSFQVTVGCEDFSSTAEFNKIGVGVFNILAFHGLIPGYSVKDQQMGKDATAFIAHLIKMKGADYVALGDVHKHVQIHDRCWYPGALVQKTYSCEDGIVLVELEGNAIATKSLKLPLPKKINLHLDMEEGKDSEETIISYVKENVEEGQFVRLVFSIPVDFWATLNKEYIQNSLKTYCLEVKLENDPIQEKRSRANLKEVEKAKTVEEELDIIIEEDSFGLDKEKLKSSCRKFVA